MTVWKYINGFEWSAWRHASVLPHLEYPNIEYLRVRSNSYCKSDCAEEAKETDGPEGRRSKEKRKKREIKKERKKAAKQWG